MRKKVCYFKQHEINRQKWDTCILQADNALIYGLSGYLDVVAEHWDALVLGDYDAVMPLPWRRKFGLKHIYHPFFSQQLGVFYKNGIDVNFTDFLKQIPLQFIRIESSINAGIPNIHKPVASFPNFILDLSTSYENLYSRFNSNTKRNLKKAEKRNQKNVEPIPCDEFLHFKKKNLVSNIGEQQFDTLHQLFDFITSKQLGEVLGVRNEEGDLLAAAMFTQFKGRITYLLSASSDDGKELRSMFKVINHVVRSKADTHSVLDFEGSRIPGVAIFFKGFGAEPEYYNRIVKYFPTLLR